MWVAFAVQKLHVLTFFSAKNIRILYIESAKTVNEMILNELVKLTTLWTTGPWSVFNRFSFHFNHVLCPLLLRRSRHWYWNKGVITLLLNFKWICIEIYRKRAFVLFQFLVNKFMPSDLFFLNFLERSISNRRGVSQLFLILIHVFNANILDPDQTLHWRRLILIYTVCQRHFCGKTDINGLPTERIKHTIGMCRERFVVYHAHTMIHTLYLDLWYMYSNCFI